MKKKEKKDLRKVAYEYLLNAMTNFDILPGEPVVEQDISDMLGISRTPVREAMKQLEADGFVYHIHQKGTFVSGVTNTDIEEIFELRMILELSAVENAVAAMDKEMLLALRQEILDLEPDAADEDRFRLDGFLHRQIVDSMYNSRISKMFGQLSQQIGFLRRLSSRTPDRLKLSRNEHLNIIDALVAREPDKVRELLSQHLENVKTSTLRVNQLLRTRGDIKQKSPFRPLKSIPLK